MFTHLVNRTSLHTSLQYCKAAMLIVCINIMHAVLPCTVHVQLAPFACGRSVHTGTPPGTRRVQKAAACLHVPIAPASAFRAYTHGFCKRGSLPEVLLSVFYSVLTVATGFAGAAALDLTGYFGFYQVLYQACVCTALCLFSCTVTSERSLINAQS